MLAPILRGFLDLLAPRECPGCESALGTTRVGLCPLCESLLEGLPSGLSPPARSAALFVHGGPVADGMRRFKYEGRTDLGRELATLLLRAAPHYEGRVDRVIPMPLHRQRLATRGFNPSVVLAAPLAEALRVPLDVEGLVRTRDTRPQVGLSAAERAANLDGAFFAREELGRVLLIDDVRTTGATLAEASAALVDAGAEVRSLALLAAEDEVSSRRRA